VNKGAFDMITHFYLVRHGETDWNKSQRLQGHTDIPLNETGRKQAEKIGKRMANLPLQVICSSDLERARKTAEEIYKYHTQCVFTIPKELRERCYGEWEGMTFGEIQKKFPEQQKGKVMSGKAGIETLEDLKSRGNRELQRLAEKYRGQHIAVVSHGGFINAVLHLYSNGLHGTGITKMGNTAFNHLSYEKEAWMIHTVNDTTHLNE